MLLNHNINNLSGGVSQQPEESRFDNQVESMNNCLITVAQGIRRRNPIIKLSEFSRNLNSNMISHEYDRGDGLEKYGMFLDDNGIIVFNEYGSEIPVALIPSSSGTIPLSNWTVSNWKKDVKFLTVGDTTFILNRNMQVKMKDDLSPNLNSKHKAFYWLKRSFDDGVGGGYTYQVVVNGVTVSKESPSSISCASSMASTINGITGITSRSSGSIVYIESDNPFTFEFGDSWGNQASFGWQESVAKISDLPASMSGFTTEEVGIITITGTDTNNFNNYYLKWEDDHWIETMKDGLLYKIDETTMPIRLIRNELGTFELSFIDSWKDRLKGDDISNPLPSFIDDKISNIFFFKNRLGFTSEENVILSEASSYYNFTATTVIEVLDNDPIDASVDSNTVSIIRFVNIAGGGVTLWADSAQFFLTGTDILSPSTTRISQTSSYDSYNGLEPILIDNEILFFNKAGRYLDVLTYSPASFQNDDTSAESISSHIPTYIPSTIVESIVSSSHNLVFLKDSIDLNTLYIYKYHIVGNEKVISSWFKWTFEDEIKSISIIGGSLYLYANTNELLKIELEPIDVESTFLDRGTNQYVSNLVMSKFNFMTNQKTRVIREPLYVKNIKVNTSGKVDLDIINEERNSIKTVNSKHINRKLVIGGNSDKVRVGFSANYDTGFQIDTLSIEGKLNSRSKNI